jgi:tetratricopeptide (TPR) repeat protein
MTTRQSALFALVLGSLGLFALSGCSAGNPNMSAAESAMEQQNYNRALSNVDSALTQDSANVDAYLMRARILRQMADSTMPPNEYRALYSRARKAEASALKFAPGQQSTVRSQRERTFIQEYQKGAKAFNAARRSQSRDAFLRAASYFGAAGATQPDSTGPILNEAFSRLRAARLQEEDRVASEMNTVIPVLERYIEKEDRPTKDAYTILSQLYLQNEQYSRALTLTKQAIDDLSNRPTLLRFSGTRGVQYVGTVETERGSRSVEGTTPSRVPLSANEGTVRGTFYKTEGGGRQLQGQLRVQLYKQGTRAASGQAVAISDTVSFSADLSAVSPLADLQNSRLNALNQTGNTEQAMQAYERQIERTPNDATYRYNYGSLLLNADRYDEAATQLSKAAELDPDDPKKQYNLGAAYLNKGVMLQDSLVSLRDSLVAQDQTPTAEEEEMVERLNEERRSLFEKSIPPLERARQLSGADGRYSQSACTALFQAYVQTEQTEKAQEVKECSAQTSQSNGGDR